MEKLSLVLVLAAAYDADRSQLGLIDCEFCKCADRFWPNCTNNCAAAGNLNTNNITALETVLTNIGPSCQVYAEVTLAQPLLAADWCKSDGDRKGFIIATPQSALDGFSVTDGRVNHQYLLVEGLSCKNKQADGYVIYEASHEPDSTCKLDATPARLIVQDYEVQDKQLVEIPLTPLVNGEIRNSSLGQWDAIQNLDAGKPFNVRYIANDQDDHKCFGTPSSITFVREISGLFNGRKWDTFGYRNDKNVAKTAKAHQATMWTGAVGNRPENNAIWDNERYNQAPGFDMVRW